MGFPVRKCLPRHFVLLTPWGATLIIRCTQKLLKELSIKPHEPAVVSEVGSWHANLLIIERRKCVLFTHDMSLFSVFVVGLMSDDFAHMDEIFGQALFRTLRLCEFGQSEIERMLDWSRHNVYAKSNNRSVLGSMKDLGFQIEHRIEADGGLGATDLDDLRIAINGIPFKAIKYGYPRRRLAELLGGAGR